MDNFTVEFEVEKETKNTIRFQEKPVKGQPAKIGTLYVQKYACIEGVKTVTLTVQQGK